MVYGYNNPYPPSVGSFPRPVVPPSVDPDEGSQWTVCFSVDWLPFIIGALQQLTLQATWQGTETEILEAQNRAMLLIAMFGSQGGGCANGVCFTDILYDDTTDTVQQSFDGGMTYIDNPSADPRHADAFRFPALTGSDPRCQAAHNMRAYLEDLISQVEGALLIGAAVTSVAAIIAPLALTLGPFAIFFELVDAVADIMFTGGAVALEAAFTSTVYEQLECIFYCSADANGQVSASRLADIKANIDTDLSGLAATVLDGMLLLMGEVGLSNAGTMDAGTADCSGCTDCDHKLCIDFAVTDGSEYGITPVQSASPDNVTYSAGLGWVGGFVDSVNVNDLSIDLVIPSTIELIDATWTYDKTNGAGSNNATVVRATHPHINYYTTQVAISTGGSAGVGLQKTLTYSGDVDGLYIGLDSGTAGASIVLRRLEVRYRETIPSGWSDNC